MIGPVVVQGRAPSNVIELGGASYGVLVVMRRPAMVRSQATAIRWYIGCQAEILLNERTLVTVPAYPRRRIGSVIIDELALAPLPAAPRVVAGAYFPLSVARWRFEFSTDEPDHPDATAEVWLHELRQEPAACGLFRAPFRI